MGRHRLLTAGLSVALLLAAGSPALAAPGNGKAKGHTKGPAQGQAKGHAKKPAPAPKAPKAPKAKPVKETVNGGGTVTGGGFSVQAGNGKSKGHFNYTSTNGEYKLRCKGVKVDVDGKTATVTDSDCRLTTGPESARRTETGVTVSAVFTDNGQPAENTPGPDTLTLTVKGTTEFTDALVTGNVKVRPQP